jgi:hypothetical protein
MLVRAKFKIVLVTVLFPMISKAEAPFIEYSHWGSGEQAEINSPRLVDGEYQSDRLTYEFLNQWNAFWWKQDQVFQYTAGSLGPTRFLTQGRIRFSENITDRLKFSFFYAEVGDYTQWRQSFVFEFSYKLNSLFEVALYGQPSTFKKDDDIGVALITWLGEHSYVRAFYTWVDFSLNKRNENSDYYQKKPGTVGAVWRHSPSKDSEEFVEIFVKRDLETIHVFPESSRSYAFLQTQAGVKWIESFGEIPQYFQMEINARKSLERDTENSDQGIIQWEAQHYDGLFQIRNPTSRLKLYGLRFNYSQWDSTQGQVIHRDILPHTWFNIYNNTYGKSVHNIDLGYEFTWHLGEGSDFLRSQLDTDNKVNHRINTRYAFYSDEKTRFHLLLTFDGDKFGTGETWEGGSIQFSQIF